MPLTGGPRTHIACSFALSLVCAACVLNSARLCADEPSPSTGHTAPQSTPSDPSAPASPPPQSTKPAEPATPPDEDLIEFLGSIGSEDEDWLNYLAQSDPQKLASQKNKHD